MQTNNVELMEVLQRCFGDSTVTLECVHELPVMKECKSMI